jgi:ATP-dependent DNA ligase
LARVSSNRCSASPSRSCPKVLRGSTKKLDGYRAIALRTKIGVELWSRNKKNFSHRFPNVARALETLPVETVLDGEIVVTQNPKTQPAVS